MSYTQNTAPQLGGLSYTITGGTATTGGIASIPNPEGIDLVLRDARLLVTANSTGAANLTIGTAPSPGTAATNSLLTATAMAAAAGKIYDLGIGGTVVATDLTATAKWGSADYLVVNGSASTVGLSAILFVDYYRSS
jgi:hypothetical protein